MLRRWWDKIVARYFRRPVRGRPDPNYVPQQLSDDPLVEHFRRNWRPGQLSPALSAKIAKGGYASLSNSEEWEILLSCRVPPGALDE
jgi:hypothetical protein